MPSAHSVIVAMEGDLHKAHMEENLYIDTRQKVMDSESRSVLRLGSGLKCSMLTMVSDPLSVEELFCSRKLSSQFLYSSQYIVQEGDQ